MEGMSERKILVPSIEGTEVYIPVLCRAISAEAVQILDDSVFDYDDQSLLFKFGPNDIVSTHVREFSDGTTNEAAFRLISSGDERNDEKRVLLTILQCGLELGDLVSDSRWTNTINFLRSYDFEESPYPGIREWFIQHNAEFQRPTSTGPAGED